jgi:hypothetical protein
MSARLSRALLVASLASLAACEELSAPTPVETIHPLNVQVRNSGLPGGYLWLAVIGQRAQGRWHHFGEAEFICVTCPEPFIGTGSHGYELAVLDESCRLLEFAGGVAGGSLLVEIDPGPTITIDDAPPLGDWMPADSTPAPLGNVPCSPPEP